ncbi:MAG: MarR family winged helix-turn-helix transcriptional regulator [Helicobacteraceae bacterium]|jgi:DNA-binding MarR family transcriptional regulator|nr:MarR family winged helix-turn-helix transcriptional regulator [Helicobacteraceae bacterium]
MIFQINDLEAKNVSDAKKLTEMFQQNHTIMHEFAESIGLSFDRQEHGLFAILELLEKSGKIRLKDLAQRLGMTSSSLCVALGKMGKEKLVEREIDAKDRRNTYYFISPPGQIRLADMENRVTECIIRLFESLSKKELKALYEATRLINEILMKRAEQMKRAIR